jgi:hypothetical protein
MPYCGKRGKFNSMPFAERSLSSKMLPPFLIQPRWAKKTTFAFFGNSPDAFILHWRCTNQDL